jgi:acetylornithine/succinyldiaminopimelate/putrescine aminotransferase
MKKCLTQVAADVRVATEVRGRGCMQSLELNIQARPVVDAALKRGLLLNSTQEVVLRLLPSFLIKKEHVDEMAETLRAVLTA